MSSSKRRQDLQLTRETHDDDSFDERDKIDPARKANSSILAGRKIAQPRKRRIGINGTSSVFGSNSSSSSSNPFAALSNSGSISSTTPTNSNPFASLASNSASTSTFTTSTAPFATLNSASTATPDSSILYTALNENFYQTITSVLKSKVDQSWKSSLEKYLKYAEDIESGRVTPSLKINQEQQPNQFNGFTSGNSGTTPSTPSTATGGFSFGSSVTASSATSADPTSKPFTFAAPAAVDADTKKSFPSAPAPAPASAPPPATTTTASVSDSDSDSDSEEEKEIKIQGPTFSISTLPTAKRVPFSFNKPAEKKHDSDSDSEDDIKIEGPTFTLDKLPTSKSTPFSLKQDNTVSTSSTSPFSFASSDSTKKEFPKQEDNETKATTNPFSLGSSNTTTTTVPPQANSFSLGSETKAAPSFSFSSPATSTSSAESKPFSFGATSSSSNPPEKKDESEVKPAPFSFTSPSSNLIDHSWSPQKGIKFGLTDKNESTPTSKAEPIDSSTTVANSKSDSVEKENTKPLLFSSNTSLFGGSTSSSSNASFNFPSKSSDASDNTTIKPFSFGAPSASSTAAPTTVSSASAATTPFSFGAPSTTTASTSSPFSFGAPAPAVASAADSKPSPFSFGSTTSVPFSFSTPSQPATATAAPAAATTSTDDDGEAMPLEPQTDLSGKGAGEEDETAAYEKKAKVYELVGKEYKVQGVGPLRVLVHNTNGKSRVVMRAEGSGRVVLNSLLRKELKYTTEGKGQVKMMDIKADGSPTTYLIRVKTEQDGQELRDALEKHKS